MMKFKAKFSANAEKYFAKLPKDTQKRIIDKLCFFESSGEPLKFAKNLQGSKKHYRFRIGDYRAIFTLKDNGDVVILLILKISHRKEIYSQ